ncbi:MAG: hypothetical protein R2738_06555 [Bacteroides graminisolvens]
MKNFTDGYTQKPTAEEINTRYEGPAGNYGAFYENIYHLRLNEALETDASEVLDVIRIIEAAYQSHKEERIIHLR